MLFAVRVSKVDHRSVDGSERCQKYMVVFWQLIDGDVMRLFVTQSARTTPFRKAGGPYASITFTGL